MLLFGHIGITLLIIYAIARIIKLQHIDYRIVILMSILPDLIDKTLGHLLWPDYFKNGWLFAHTLLFNLSLIIIIGLIKPRFCIYGFSSFLHLMEDRVWISSKNFLWPFYGLKFPEGMYYHYEDYLRIVFYEYTHPNPYLALEVIGIIIIIIIIKNNFLKFIKTGNL